MMRPTTLYGALATVLALAGAAFAAPAGSPVKAIDAWVEKAEKHPPTAPAPLVGPKPVPSQPVRVTDCYDETYGGFAPCPVEPPKKAPTRVGGALLEAEARVADAGACGSEGEAMRPLKQHDAKGGAILEFPGSGCWAVWKAHFEAPSKRLVVGALMPSGAGPNCVVWDLYLDADHNQAGAYLGSTTAHCSKKEHKTATLEVLNGGASILIPAGAHGLYAYARIALAPGFEESAQHVHAFLDFLATGDPADEGHGSDPGQAPVPVKPGQPQPVEPTKAPAKPKPAKPGA